jgi:hypothetical protein
VSTECAGEGRNVDFCRRLVLFDLPWRPSIVEQRIGRFDRIGRRIPVDIVYFRPPGGIGADIVRLFEALDLFREPVAGLEPQLAHVEGALEEIALGPLASLSGARLESLVSEARAARTRIREIADHEALLGLARRSISCSTCQGMAFGSRVAWVLRHSGAGAQVHGCFGSQTVHGFKRRGANQ